MRYVFMAWVHDGEKFSIAHDLGSDDWSTKDVAYWMRKQLDDEKYPSFAFAELTKEQYDWYGRRKLTTENFGQD